MTLGTILHPTDFSPSAERALEVAVRFAAASRAGLVMLHAELLHGDSPRDTRTTLDEYAASARRRLAELSANDPPAVEVMHRRAILADEAILDAAQERKADLIVTGTHGRRGLSRLLMGSTAERLLRKAACHVLTVRADAVVPDATVFRTLLVPVDFSEHSRRGLAVATALAADWHANVHLLHVVEPPPPMYYAGNVTSRFELDGDLRARIQERLHVLARGVPETRCVVAEGHPAAEIARVAADEAIDLIVMSAKGATSVDWLPIGSTTGRVCRIARKPVLATR